MVRFDRWLKLLGVLAIPLVILAFLALAAQARAQGVPAAEASGGEAAKAVVRYKASVIDSVIRLGHLFDNIGAKAEIPVEPSPAPWATTTFQPSKLVPIPPTHALNWQ